MSVTVYDVLDDLRESSTSKADQGSRLERLMATFLKTDPTYADQFSDVWLWQDWPGRGGKHDTGIDLVAIDRLTGENVAIQCKFYAPGHHVSKKDIDTFLSASGTTDFAQRIIISTGADWGPNAEATLQKQQVPVRRIGMSDLEASVVDWSQFSWSSPEQLQTVGRKVARPHQREAIDAVGAGLAERDRGKLIMACGTGKTFTSLRLAEQMVGTGGQVLFLVPSISLLSQTVREWASEAEVPLRMLAVCSDAKATKRSAAVNEDISAVDIALPATTNLAVLQERWSAAVEDPTAMTVVFSTYQSLEVVSKAQKAGGFDAFDLIVCDEAHRTTGLTLAGEDASMFVKVHDNDVVQGTKRLYMTATPRIFGDESKKKADSAAAVLASMDDEDTYGPELHRLGFGEAVERDLLTDYRVLVLAVDESYVAQNFQHELATAGEIPLGDAARIVGCWNGLAKQFTTSEDETDIPMRRAVAFAKDINASKAVAAGFPAIVDRHLDHLDPDTTANKLRVECEHVDGTFNALERNKRLDWLKADVPEGTCRVLTNARCLSEGVDVPALDAVMFLTPRSSEVDVVQSVGRVMRKSKDKDYGYIILPIVTPSNVAPEEALRDNEKYKVVWQVLQALRAHDDRFNATVNQIDLNKRRPNKIRVMGIGHGGARTKSRSDDAAAAEQLEMQWDFGQWQDAIYARIVQKVGERRYWETWARDVATIAGQHIARISGLLTDPDSPAALEFEQFVDGLRGNLNENITQDDAVEMLAQHLITRPVFEALFGGYDFAAHNPIAQRMEAMLAVLDEHTLDVENSALEGFYMSVRARAEGIDNAQGRQRIIVELYDNFFATAFKRTVDRLGIVYTPVEIVDFILRSADDLLRAHFGQGLTDEGVHILDGFTGTGTFITRLLQLGLVDPHDLARKYTNEIHANEILLLAYYIAAVNIETTYQDLRGSLNQPGDYEPFPGLILTDTFQSYEDGDRDDFTIFPINSERITRQRELPITVIIGNPPYSSGQDSANDNNANEKYDKLDAAIRDTYAARSTATNKNSLYDSYIRAIKWASLRLGDRGVIAYVTNGGWLDSNTADGMRLTLASEFSDIHIYNLRGNQRTAGEQSRREGGKVFGAGSRATVAITILVRDPDYSGSARIHYTDVGDYLTREEKLAAVEQTGTAVKSESRTISPNEHGDWLIQRRDDFETFIPIESVFGRFGRGVETARDAWVYNFSEVQLATNVERSIATYESERKAIASDPKRGPIADPTQISWSRSLL